MLLLRRSFQICSSEAHSRKWKDMLRTANLQSSQLTEKLSFVLTLASAGTGRDNQDFLRVQLLLQSFEHFFDLKHHDQFIIVSPENDQQQLAQLVAPWEKKINFLLLDENVVCPEFRSNPDTTDRWPKLNKGWYRQQLIKLAVHAHVRTPFYMTVDSDVLFVRAFDTVSLVKNGRAMLNVQRQEDYRRLYCEETVEKEVRVRQLRYQQVEAILQCQRAPEFSGQWYGETPVILNRELAGLLGEHIEKLWQKSWRQVLLDKLPWTEYPLYFLFAEENGLLERYHEIGNADTVLRLSQSFWQPASEYRVTRDLSNWDPEATFRSKGDGVAIVVQSYLGYSVDEVARLVRPHI